MKKILTVGDLLKKLKGVDRKLPILVEYSNIGEWGSWNDVDDARLVTVRGKKSVLIKTMKA